MGVLKNSFLDSHACFSLPFFIIQEVFPFMACGFGQDLQTRRRKAYTLFLAFFWFAGIFSGILISRHADSTVLSLMRSAVDSAVSIVGLLSAACLPFLLSALAVSLSGPGWLLPVGFVNGFLYSYVSMTVFRSFGFSGWLLRPLLCFSMVSVAPALYCFWLRLISAGRESFFSETAFFLSLALLIGSVDYSLISPFLARLIS